jgi:pimeloyl-ACP methyl ester carboxylesterase
VARRPRAPLEPGWVIVGGLPIYHRARVHPSPAATSIVHVHGFGISGTYLEPAAAVLARRHSCFVPDLPGMGRSPRPDERLDLPGLTHALVGYCDAIGVDRATFVGNSLGCPLIIELAAAFPDRIDRAVLVSPAGGPNNQPLGRALGQMVVDAFREPLGMLPIAARDYLHFGVISGFALFRSMTRYDTLERLRLLEVPTLVIAGTRDPLVRIERAHVFAGLPVTCVAVPGAHALNFSAPELIGSLVDAFVEGEPLVTSSGPRSVVTSVPVPPVDAR